MKIARAADAAPSEFVWWMTVDSLSIYSRKTRPLFSPMFTGKSQGIAAKKFANFLALFLTPSAAKPAPAPFP